MIGTRTAHGFSKLELVIAIGILTVIVSSVAGLVNNVQQIHIFELDRTEIQQNQRYAMDTLLRAIRGAGNDPQGIGGVKFDLDPNGDGQHNDLRVRSDFNPPDGDIDDASEDLLFFLDGGILMVQDTSPGDMTHIAQNFSAVGFEYFDAAGNSTDSSAETVRVRVTLTGVSSRPNPRTGQYQSFSLTDEGTVRHFQEINAAADATTTTTSTLPNGNG